MAVEHVTVPLAAGKLHVETPSAAMLHSLCAFASRQNPKRGFLFVSRALGKHLQAAPAALQASHEGLAAQLAAYPLGHGVLFMGFAETATGLGAGVFEAYARLTRRPDLLCVQTTRYRFADRELALHFQEEHSHATGHLLYHPEIQQRVFFEGETLVLVDDEFSTGNTCLNFLRAFLDINPRVKTVAFVSLLDWMGDARRAEIAGHLADKRVLFVSALRGQFRFERDAQFVCPPMPQVTGNDEPKDALVPASFGRFGFSADSQFDFRPAAVRLALRPSEPLVVLGDGEYLHPPFKFAQFLAEQGHPVHFQATTRSPILRGHAIQSTVTFRDHYDDGIPNYLHNPPCAENARVLLCHESAGELALAEQLNVTPVAYQEFLCA